jgi:hypothetical protein
MRRFAGGGDREDLMDDCRFDNWTRMLGKLQDRRVALKELAGAGAALFSLAKLDLGLVQAQDVNIAGCKAPGQGCSKAGDCCSNKCTNSTKKECKKKKKGKKKKCSNKNVDGVCKCIDLGNNGCGGRDIACCKGHCEGDTCKCVGPKGICNTNEDCCENRKCTGGFCES